MNQSPEAGEIELEMKITRREKAKMVGNFWVCNRQVRLTLLHPLRRPLFFLSLSL